MKKTEEKHELCIKEIQITAEENLKKFGYLVPIVMIVNNTEAFLVNVAEATEDRDAMDQLFKWTAGEAREKKAHKVYFVTEVIKHEMNKEKLIKSTDAYQIVEIMQDRINVFIRDLIKKNNTVKFISKGEFTENTDQELFKDIQSSLQYLQ